MFLSLSAESPRNCKSMQPAATADPLAGLTAEQSAEVIAGCEYSVAVDRPKKQTAACESVAHSADSPPPYS
jgi:hypothetical protein